MLMIETIAGTTAIQAVYQSIRCLNRTNASMLTLLKYSRHYGYEGYILVATSIRIVGWFGSQMRPLGEWLKRHGKLFPDTNPS